MTTGLDTKNYAQYSLSLNEDKVDFNSLIGQTLEIRFLGKISCVSCQKKIKKTYNSGYCYPCFFSLARNDMCIVKPELCHFHRGTCREPEWGEKNCFIDHIIYLSNTSGLKVGITRSYRKIQRWIDQGASQGLAILKVKKRLDAGKVEVVLKEHMNDKTNWRKMLKGKPERQDLESKKKEVLKNLEGLKLDFEVLDEKPYDIYFPHTTVLDKVSSLSLDKTPEIKSKLIGIKAQYLIFSDGVFNVRKFSGYHVKIAV